MECSRLQHHKTAHPFSGSGLHANLEYVQRKKAENSDYSLQDFVDTLYEVGRHVNTPELFALEWDGIRMQALATLVDLQYHMSGSLHDIKEQLFYSSFPGVVKQLQHEDGFLGSNPQPTPLADLDARYIVMRTRGRTRDVTPQIASLCGDDLKYDRMRSTYFVDLTAATTAVKDGVIRRKLACGCKDGCASSRCACCKNGMWCNPFSCRCSVKCRNQLHHEMTPSNIATDTSDLQEQQSESSDGDIEETSEGREEEEEVDDGEDDLWEQRATLVEHYNND